MDKLIVDNKGGATISNDGATIMKLLDIVHPAAKTLVDIAKSQDAEVGDGTTSVVILAGAQHILSTKSNTVLFTCKDVYIIAEIGAQVSTFSQV